MRQGYEKARHYTENCKPLVNRKNNKMVVTRRALASKVGVAMVDGRGMRAAAYDRGQPRTIAQARDDCNKNKNLVKSIIRIT